MKTLWQKHIEQIELLKALARAEKVASEKARDARAKQIIDMRKQGMSLRQIGDRFGITRERVRQIINKNVGDSIRDAYWDTHRKIFTCPACKTQKKVPVTWPKKFCSKKCLRTDTFLRKYVLNQEETAAKRAARLEYVKVRMQQWKEKYRNTPAYKEVARLRNKGVKGISIHDFEYLNKKNA